MDESHDRNSRSVEKFQWYINNKLIKTLKEIIKINKKWRWKAKKK
jgi:hypothetical protein